MKKKRVLIISNYFWTIEKFRKNLILDLRKNDFEVSICAMFDGYEKQFSEDGFATIDLNIDLNGKNPINEFKTLRDIFSLLKNGKFDFVYTFSIKPNIYTSVCAQLFNSTHVATVTGLGTLYYSKTLTILMNILYYACVSHRTKIIVQNDDDKKIVQSITRSSVYVEKINGSGVDLKEFNYTKPINEDITYFLYVGRLIRDKGVHHYLEVAEKLKRRYGKEVEFHLVGPLGVKNSSAIKDSELDYYIRGNYVTYHGYQHDIRQFLKKKPLSCVAFYTRGNFQDNTGGWCYWTPCNLL